MKQSHLLAAVILISAMAGGYIGALGLPAVRADDEGVAADNGRYVLVAATVTIRRGGKAEPLKEQAVLRIATRTGVASRYVENVNDEGKIARRWFSIHEAHAR